MTMTILTTSVILFTLIGASVFFNHYIERRPQQHRADGETALWVAIGCAYAIAGAVLLVTVWAVQMGYDWHVGLLALAAILTAFTAAGIPMFWGDMRRNQAWRQTNEYLDRAERMNGHSK